MRHRATAMALAAVALAAAGANAQQRYAQPLTAPNRVTGTFAELRPNHFHTGLDLGTLGVEGHEIYAAEDGWVSRIAVSPYGYGKALYIDHPDGHTTVYAHLSRYAAPIDSVVRAEQYAQMSFAVDMTLNAGAVPVRRGQVVAYSGNSGGSGGPHLHFEVRDTKSERPINPLEFISIAPDSTPPTIYGVKLYSTDDTTTVNGRLSDRYLQRSQINGRTLTAHGAVGFGIVCNDYVEPGGRPCGAVQIDLYDNDRLIFRSRIDSLDFGIKRHYNSHIDYAHWQESKQFVERSLVSPGNLFNFYDHAETPLRIGDGEKHAMRYEVRDHAGNVAKVSFTLVGRKPEKTASKSQPKGETVRWDSAWGKDTLGISVSMSAKTLFEDNAIEIVQTELTNGRHGITVGSAKIPLQRAANVTLPLPVEWDSIADKAFVGRISGKSISYCGGSLEEVDGRKIVSGQSLQLGTFTVDVDTVAPRVRVRNTRGVKQTGRPNIRQDENISIGIADDLTGIGSYSVFIDGEWSLFEFDYKKTRLIATPRSLKLREGVHLMEVSVTDNRGNKSTIVQEIKVLK